MGVKKIIIASSETTYGVCFAQGDADYHSFPLEEDYDVDPEDSYALSKICAEKTARTVSRRSPSNFPKTMRLTWSSSHDGSASISMPSGSEMSLNPTNVSHFQFFIFPLSSDYSSDKPQMSAISPVTFPTPPAESGMPGRISTRGT